MGRTSATKYAIWMTGCTPACWDIKQNGAPTVENLTRYVTAYAKSLELGQRESGTEGKREGKRDRRINP